MVPTLIDRLTTFLNLFPEHERDIRLRTRPDSAQEFIFGPHALQAFEQWCFSLRPVGSGSPKTRTPRTGRPRKHIQQSYDDNPFSEPV